MRGGDARLSNRDMHVGKDTEYYLNRGFSVISVDVARLRRAPPDCDPARCPGRTITIARACLLLPVEIVLRNVLRIGG